MNYTTTCCIPTKTRVRYLMTFPNPRGYVTFNHNRSRWLCGQGFGLWTYVARLSTTFGVLLTRILFETLIGKRAIDVDHPIKTIEVGYDSFVRDSLGATLPTLIFIASPLAGSWHVGHIPRGEARIRDRIFRAWHRDIEERPCRLPRYVPFSRCGSPCGIATSIERTTTEHDVLLAVFGRAGPASKNDSREVIHSIGFIVFNTESGETHTFGVRP